MCLLLISLLQCSRMEQRVLQRSGLKSSALHANQGRPCVACVLHVLLRQLVLHHMFLLLRKAPALSEQLVHGDPNSLKLWQVIPA